MRIKNYLSCALILLSFYSCRPEKAEKKKKDVKLNFEKFKGIRYYEVKRRFSNGLSFDSSGFQLEPVWAVEFLSNDSISAWDPEKLRWSVFPIMYDHGTVYNLAYEYFRVKLLSADSLVMQRLEVKSMEVKNDYRSDVNLTFYSRAHIFKVLKSNPDELRKPGRADSNFIKKLVLKSLKNASTPDSLFAGRIPVRFISLYKGAEVRQIDNANELQLHTKSYNYMYPEYRITLNNSPEDFLYTCTAIVDAAGNLLITEATGTLQGEELPRRKKLQAIADTYLKKYFKIIPGKTLGIDHPTQISLYIAGNNGN